MKRNLIVNKLIGEGFSEKTLSRLTDKGLMNLSERIFGEQLKTVSATGGVQQKPEDQIIVPNKMDINKKTKVADLGKEIGASVEMKEGKGKKDKKWIQKAVDSKHKGDCTPMTKPTCTPKRKALAKRFKSKEFDESKQIKEWIGNLIENEYSSITTKNEILSLIKRKINEQAPVTAPPKIKPDTKPGTKPGKPKPQEDDDPYVDPFEPAHGPGTEPKFKKKGRTLSNKFKEKILSLIDSDFIANSINENTKKKKRA